MRAAIGLGVAAAVCVLAAPAAAQSISVPYVKFSGSGSDAAAFAAPAGDVNGDGHDDVIIGAPAAWTGPDEDGGVAYVVFGPFVAGTMIDLRDVGDRGLVLRASGWRAGSSVAGAGDVNGDGLDDLLVGAPRRTRGSTESSRAWVVFGRRDPATIELTALRRAGITLRGKRYNVLPDLFGWQVAPLGDMDRDGLADVGILAQGEYTAPRKRLKRPGSVYVVFGRRRGGSLSMAQLGRAGFRIGFPRQGRWITSAGDWNADGRADVAVTGVDTPTMGVRVWIVYGHRYRRTVRLSQLGEDGVAIHGPEGAWLGKVAGGEDVDGDRRPDVVIGTPSAHVDPSSPLPLGGGGAWLIRGSRSPTTLNLSAPGARAWEIARGQPASVPDMAGSSVALGFVNGDRLADVVLNTASGVAVVYGNASRTTRLLSALSPAEGFHIRAQVEGGLSQLSMAGDMNGDGHADLLAGTVGPAGGTGAASYMLFSP